MKAGDPESSYNVRVRAEISVTDSDGDPVSSLPDSAFALHVMFADSQAGPDPGPDTTKVGWLSWEAPGYYSATVDVFHVGGPVPVALGVAVTAPQRLAKGDHPDRGQVVVPVSSLVV